MEESEKWQLLKDTDQRIEKVASAALAQVGRNDTVIWAQLGVRRGAGAIDAECDELWCVRISGFETEIRECLAVNEGPQEMIAKFAKRFAALPKP